MRGRPALVPLHDALASRSEDLRLSSFRLKVGVAQRPLAFRADFEQLEQVLESNRILGRVSTAQELQRVWRTRRRSSGGKGRLLRSKYGGSKLSDACPTHNTEEISNLASFDVNQQTLAQKATVVLAVRM